MITTLKKSPLSCPTRARAPLAALVIAALLLAAAPAPAKPIADHGELEIYRYLSSTLLLFDIRHPFSFTTDGASDFSGGSDSTSGKLSYSPVNQARWGKFASGHLDLTITSQTEQDFDYGIFGSARAQSQTYHASVELVHGFDEHFETFGLTDVDQWRFNYIFDFDFEIRWHRTSAGIEPKLRSISGPSDTKSYFCRQLVGLQGGCATTGPLRSVSPLSTSGTNLAAIRRAAGTGDWTLYLEFTVMDITVRHSFPLLGDQKEVPRGSITVSLENETPCCDKTSIDEAQVTLIRQSDYLRTQRAGETDAAYQSYLDARTSFAVDSADVVVGSDTVTFNNVPFYGLGRRGAATPFWYAVKITAAQTEEIDINQDPVDPNITATTFFIPELNTNLRPSQTVPPPVHNFLITPTDAIGAKLNIIADMTDAKAPCAVQYKAAEDTMQAGLDAYVASPGSITPANIEGVKRALWAERVVRAGADYTDQALDVVLGGLATVLGDLFDDADATDFKRADLKKRTEELEAMGRRAGFQPVAFYTDLGLDKKQVVEAMALDTTLANGQVADFAKGTLKVFKQTMIDSCVQAGINPDDCERDIGRITLAFISILNGISTQTLAGTAKAGIKTFIEFLVKAAKGPIFDVYCSSTAPDLSTAVTSGLGWSAFSDGAYRDDARKVSDLLRELSSAATVIGNAQALQIAADGLDRTGDALDVVAIVGKPAKVVAEIVKFTKYVVNLEAIAAAMTLVVRTPFDVQEGTLAAFGQSLPLLRAAESAPATAASHARGGTEVSALAARATSLKAAEFAIRQALGNDDIPAAIQAAADTSDPDAYVNHLAAWTLEIERFKAIVTATRATGSMGSLLSSFALADAELKLAHAEFLASLRELLVAVDTVTYPSPTSRDYLVHRDSVVSQLFLIRNKIDGFIDAVSSLDSAMAGQPVTPFIFSHVTSLAPLTTSAEMITQSPEEFELTVQLENMSTTALNNVTARLVVDSPKDSMTMTTPSDTVIGGLAGGATTNAVWRFRYDGDLSDELIGLRVELLENDTTPTSFDFSEPHTSVFVDPAISDQDGDNMPDDWEVAHGLDATRDDSAEDFDGDGLSNLSESFYGLDPAVKDTDGDSVFDGDELLGLNNGFLTDPLDPDSDADLVNDGADAQPLDASITASSPPAAMGRLQLSTDTVVLTSSNLFETVNVTNIGPGSITWGTTVDNDAVALVTPRDPQMITDDGAIGISVPSYFDFNQAFRTRTTIRVADVAYPDNAPQQISVVIVGDNAPAQSTTTTTMPPLVCGDASGDGIITATDALAALRTAVGSGACPTCLCDVNSNGTTTATDALALLRSAVGQAVGLVCAPCSF